MEKSSEKVTVQERTFFLEIISRPYVLLLSLLCYVFMPSKKLFSLSLSCAQRTLWVEGASAANKRDALASVLTCLSSIRGCDGSAWESGRGRALFLFVHVFPISAGENQVGRRAAFFITALFFSSSAQNKDDRPHSRPACCRVEEDLIEVQGDCSVLKMVVTLTSLVDFFIPRSSSSESLPVRGKLNESCEAARLPRFPRNRIAGIQFNKNAASTSTSTEKKPEFSAWLPPSLRARLKL